MHELIPIKINKSVYVLPTFIMLSKSSLRAMTLKDKHFHFGEPLGDNFILTIYTNVCTKSELKTIMQVNVEIFQWS